MYKPLLAVLLLVSLQTYSQEGLSLKKAIEIALQNNYSITISKLENSKASINNNWAATGRYPSLDLSLSSANSINYVDTDFTLTDDIDTAQARSMVNPLAGEDYTQNSLSAQLALNWILFDGFSTSIRKEKFEYLEKLSEGNTALMVENTIFSIILAYYQAVLQQERLDLKKRFEKISEDRYIYENERKKLGVSGSFELLQAENAWLEDKAERMQQQVYLQNAIRDLEYIMASENEASYTLTDSISTEIEQFDLNSLQQKMASNNQSLKLQSINLQMAINEKKSAKSNLYPRLQMSAGTQYSQLQTGYGDIINGPNTNNSLFANFSLSFNLYGGGQKRRAIKIAAIQEEIADIKLEDQKRQLNNELFKLYEEYSVRLELLELADRRIKAAELNLELAKERFKAGTINSFNYRDIQILYQNTYNAKLLAEFNFLTAHLSLLRITGGIVDVYKQPVKQ